MFSKIHINSYKPNQDSSYQPKINFFQFLTLLILQYPILSLHMTLK